MGNFRTKKYKPSQKNSSDTCAASLDVRAELLLAGKKLFAQKGLSGTSIRDIAKQAKVNSSMISYYFKSKDGLYKECLRQIGEARLQFAREVLKPTKNLEECRFRLKIFIENLVHLYLEDRDAGLIIVREYDRTHSPAEKVFKETFLKVFEILTNFFKDAQKKNFIDRNKDPFILASLFFGCISSQMRIDHIKDKVYKRSLKKISEQEKIISHLIDIFTPTKG